jgi:hypothetical protein
MQAFNFHRITSLRSVDLKRGAEQGKAKWLRHLLLHFKKFLNASIQLSQDYLAALGGP